MLEKDLTFLNEIMTHFAWEEDVITSKASIVNSKNEVDPAEENEKEKDKKSTSPTKKYLGNGEGGRRGSRRGSAIVTGARRGSVLVTSVNGVAEESKEAAKPKMMTMSEALAKANKLQEGLKGGDGEKEEKNKQGTRKTIAEQQGLGADEVLVDKLLVAIEKRRDFATQISSRVMRNLKYSGFPLETFANTTAKHGRLTSCDDEHGGRLHESIRTSLPLRNRASSAQGRFTVPTTEQCSLEVKNLIKLMRLYEGLLKGMYHTRATNEGFWTEAMSRMLRDEPAKLTAKLQWYDKRKEDMKQGFEQILKNDTRENKGLLDYKTLESREAILEHKMKEYESGKNSCARIQSSVGHLKDTVSMLSGAFHQSLKFFDNEISWLSPRIAEADKIAATLRETVACVQSSTASLTQLFKKKGKELVELEKQSTNEDADRELLALEKSMWARKMRELEKRMERNTRMAKVAASAYAITKEETLEVAKKADASSMEIRGLSEKLDNEQRIVEAMYDEFQELIKVHDEETNECHERERDVSSMKSQVNIKKVELEELTAKLMKKGGGMGMRQDIEVDLKRTNRRLGEKERDQKNMEAELSHLQQRLFELELVKMEARLERMANGEDEDSGDDDDDDDNDDDDDDSSENSDGSADVAGGGYGSDVSDAQQDAEEKGVKHMEGVKEKEKMEEERREAVRMDIAKDIERPWAESESEKEKEEKEEPKLQPQKSFHEASTSSSIT